MGGESPGRETELRPKGHSNEPRSGLPCPGGDLRPSSHLAHICLFELTQITRAIKEIQRTRTRVGRPEQELVKLA